MSSFHSDPPFNRGTTLLDGEAVEYSVGSASSYATAVPFSGAEIVGQIKIFQDIQPVTRTRLSNELVYCVAARYKPATASATLNCATHRGKAVILRTTATNSVDMQSTAEFDTNGTVFASNANINAGNRVAFIDEYFTGTLRANDIVWLVVKGPAAIAKSTGSTIDAGALAALDASTVGTAVTASSVLTLSSGTPNTINVQALGIATGTYNATTGAVVTGANTLSADTFVRTRLYGVNWGV